MTGHDLFFWAFALATCGGAIAVVVSQSVVRMAFWLIVSLGSVAGLFFLLHADFVGATQLLIYVGGTIVLLVFGLMLTASGPFLKIATSPGEGFLAGGVGLLLLSLLVWTVLTTAPTDWTGTSTAEQAFDARVAGHTTRPLGAALLGLRPQPSSTLVSAPVRASGENAQLSDGSATIQVGAALRADSELGDRPSVLRLYLPQGRVSSRITSMDADAGTITVSNRFTSIRGGANRFEIVTSGNVLTDRPRVMQLPTGIAASDMNKVPQDGSAMVLVLNNGQRTTARITEWEYDTDTGGTLTVDRPLVAKDESVGDGQAVDFDIVRLGTGYLLPFEVVSVHLLVVLVGAAYLARAKRRVAAEGQS